MEPEPDRTLAHVRPSDQGNNSPPGVHPEMVEFVKNIQKQIAEFRAQNPGLFDNEMIKFTNFRARHEHAALQNGEVGSLESEVRKLVNSILENAEARQQRNESPRMKWKREQAKSVAQMEQCCAEMSQRASDYESKGISFLVDALLEPTRHLNKFKEEIRMVDSMCVKMDRALAGHGPRVAPELERVQKKKPQLKMLLGSSVRYEHPAPMEVREDVAHKNPDTSFKVRGQISEGTERFSEARASAGAVRPFPSEYSGPTIQDLDFEYTTQQLDDGRHWKSSKTSEVHAFLNKNPVETKIPEYVAAQQPCHAPKVRGSWGFQSSNVLKQRSERIPNAQTLPYFVPVSAIRPRPEDSGPIIQDLHFEQHFEQMDSTTIDVSGPPIHSVIPVDEVRMEVSEDIPHQKPNAFNINSSLNHQGSSQISTDFTVERTSPTQPISSTSSEVITPSPPGLNSGLTILREQQVEQHDSESSEVHGSSSLHMKPIDGEPNSLNIIGSPNYQLFHMLVQLSGGTGFSEGPISPTTSEVIRPPTSVDDSELTIPTGQQQLEQLDAGSSEVRGSSSPQENSLDKMEVFEDVVHQEPVSVSKSSVLSSCQSPANILEQSPQVQSDSPASSEANQNFSGAVDVKKSPNKFAEYIERARREPEEFDEQRLEMKRRSLESLQSVGSFLFSSDEERSEKMCYMDLPNKKRLYVTEEQRDEVTLVGGKKFMGPKKFKEYMKNKRRMKSVTNKEESSQSEESESSDEEFGRALNKRSNRLNFVNKPLCRANRFDDSPVKKPEEGDKQLSDKKMDFGTKTLQPKSHRKRSHVEIEDEYEGYVVTKMTFEYMQLMFHINVPSLSGGTHRKVVWGLDNIKKGFEASMVKTFKLTNSEEYEDIYSKYLAYKKDEADAEQLGVAIKVPYSITVDKNHPTEFSIKNLSKNHDVFYVVNVPDELDIEKHSGRIGKECEVKLTAELVSKRKEYDCVHVGYHWGEDFDAPRLSKRICVLPK